VIVQSFLPDDLRAAVALEPQALRADVLFAIRSGVFHAGLLPAEPCHGVNFQGNRQGEAAALMGCHGRLERSITRLPAPLRSRFGGGTEPPCASSGDRR